MKIYVSGSFSEQVRLRKEADSLWQAGHVITGSWLQEVKKPETLSESEWMVCLAVKDIAELAAADCIIMDIDGTSTTGGRYVEWGYALGLHSMLKIVVGAKSNEGVFNSLADQALFSWDDVRAYLAARTS